MGSHVLDVGGQLHKTRLDSNGIPKAAPQPAPKVAVPDNHDHVQPAVGHSSHGQNLNELREHMGEGCNVHGTMIVKKVPGNFHISCHAHADLVHFFFGSKPMNVTHYVHDLSFGEQTEHLRDVEEANTHALNGAFKVALPDPNDSQSAVSYEYYIKIVPTLYERINREIIESYQFVANSNELAGKYRLPAIYFRYEFSPITVKFTEKRKSFSHFLVQICAIVGGVFTVLGLVNSILHSTLKTVLKKANMGKLG
jgi:hypothetical protein